MRVFHCITRAQSSRKQEFVHNDDPSRTSSDTAHIAGVSHERSARSTPPPCAWPRVAFHRYCGRPGTKAERRCRFRTGACWPATLGGDGLCVGYDSEDKVSEEYEVPYTFTDGTILGVAIDVGEDVYLDLEKEAAGALARD